MSAALALLQPALLVALAPLFSGTIAAIKARLQMRRGAPVWQRYADLARLFREGCRSYLMLSLSGAVFGPREGRRVRFLSLDRRA